MTGRKEQLLFVEKKKGFRDEADRLLWDLKAFLKIEKLKTVRIINLYKLIDVPYHALRGIFDSPQTDTVTLNTLPISESERMIGIRYVKGQYDSRAYWAKECVQILTGREPIPCEVETARIILVNKDIGETDFLKIKGYLINPVECEAFDLNDLYRASEDTDRDAPDTREIENFLHYDADAIKRFLEENRLAMSPEDLKICQRYFREEARRNPTETEIKIIDTYWSDHCRHKTFNTGLSPVRIQDEESNAVIQKAFEHYLKVKAELNPGVNICLMDLATIGAKELKTRGLLKDLEVSEENNACSIVIDVETEQGGGKTTQEWLLMFKNETHNHPTEIEPYGGAATCLGGAIRDPLSGRSYVYHAMRLSGSGDPNLEISRTLEGKLPSKKIAIESAKGFSSYGNQIGIATGIVEECYDEGFVAKRMEVGAVIGAAPKDNVVRQRPKENDNILLIGGRTGRDGIGGATGSSKTHNRFSVEKARAEVQKGNPVEERKLQRFFRNPEATRLMKKCNDFGAGGVSVAIGELAEGLEIHLDRIPKKYAGLDATELAISESQERMAVVVAPENTQRLIDLCCEENLEATVVARVSGDGRIVMKYRGRAVADIDRRFLDSNGFLPRQEVYVPAPDTRHTPFERLKEADFTQLWRDLSQDLNATIKKGLQEIFDTTIGARTVLMPLGGEYQLTPIQSMVAKVPVENGRTSTVSMMSYGYCPEIAKWSPFHGGFYALVDSVGKIVATGGDHRRIRLSLQEYFQKMTEDPAVWGKPFAALLGAYSVQHQLGIPAIGGKDSMSGSFHDLHVPPTLISFAVATEAIDHITSPDFKTPGSTVFLLRTPYLADFTIDLKVYEKNLAFIEKNIREKRIRSCYALGYRGIAEAVMKMCAGNALGFAFEEDCETNTLFQPMFGSFLFEMREEGAEHALRNHCTRIGMTTSTAMIQHKATVLDLEEILKTNLERLQNIYPTEIDFRSYCSIKSEEQKNKDTKTVNIVLKNHPTVFIPVFPGTNCEWDMEKAFQRAGAKTDIHVFNNLTPKRLNASMRDLSEKIDRCQILALSGGFSAGDEPEGSAKYISILLQNERVQNAIYGLLNKREGLIIGICNGFQALIKTGLLPYGTFVDIDRNPFILTHNQNGRHISKFVEIEVKTNDSPWLSQYEKGEIIKEPISHGEGRLVGDPEGLERLIRNHQIATQYKENPNGSLHAIEGLVSENGRILGKMAHSERVYEDLYKNIPNIRESRIFKAGVAYFR